MLTEIHHFRHPAWHVVARVDGDLLALRVFLERFDHDDDSTLDRFGGDLGIEVDTPDGATWSQPPEQVLVRSERSVEAQFCPVTLGTFNIRWYRYGPAIDTRYEIINQQFTITKPGPVFHRHDEHPGKHEWAARWSPNALVPTAGN